MLSPLRVLKSPKDLRPLRPLGHAVRFENEHHAVLLVSHIEREHMTRSGAFYTLSATDAHWCVPAICEDSSFGPRRHRSAAAAIASVRDVSLHARHCFAGTGNCRSARRANFARKCAEFIADEHHVVTSCDGFPDRIDGFGHRHISPAQCNSLDFEHREDPRSSVQRSRAASSAPKSSA